MLISIMFSRFIYVVAHVYQYFLPFMAEEHSVLLCGCIYTIFCLSVNGLLGCVHFLAIVNDGTVNICVQVFMWTYIFISLGYLPRGRIADVKVTLCFTF